MKQQFKIDPNIITLAVVGVVGFVGYKVYNGIFGDSEKEKAKEQLLEETVTKDYDTIIKTQSPTYSLSNIAMFANQIYEALRYSSLDDDKPLAASVLAKMGNEADVYALIKAFGIRQNYFFGIPWGDKQTLPEFVLSNLNSDYIFEVNRAWAANGIKYRL